MRDALERKIKIENLTDLVGRILVPTERIKRVKQGQQKVAERKLYPGYVFVEMELNNDGSIPERAYYLFKDTQGVGDFIGQRNKPNPMAPPTKSTKCSQARKSRKPAEPPVKVEFKKGDPVKIKEGPFENFEGTVDEIFPDKGVSASSSPSSAAPPRWNSNTGSWKRLKDNRSYWMPRKRGLN